MRDVFPAYAGMNRKRATMTYNDISVPRIRGDEPG